MTQNSLPARGPGPVKSVQWWVLTGILALWAALSFVQWKLFRLAPTANFLETLLAFALININIILLLLLIFLTFRNLAKLALERKAGLLGSRLKTRMVMTFLLVTVTPTLILFVTSAQFLNRSIDGWFSSRIEQALENSLEIARTYYNAEEDATLKAAKSVGLAVAESPLESRLLEPEVSDLLRKLAVDGIRVYLPGGLAAEEFRNAKTAEPAPEPLERAFKGEDSTQVISGEPAHLFRAFKGVKKAGSDAILAVVVLDREVLAKSIARLEEITKGYEEYRQIEHLSGAIKTSYILPLLIVSLMIIFAATWFGYQLARTIIEPISALADATQRVAHGDLDFELEITSPDEIGTLVKSFNLMTRDLRSTRKRIDSARETLTKANVELESWRLYMQTIMERITAGVVSVDENAHITTINHAAMKMLGLSENAVGKRYDEVLSPEVLSLFNPIAEEMAGKRLDVIRKQVQLPSQSMQRTLMLHIATLREPSGKAFGTVVVLNDLTDLVKAERAQAWREVAKRVAHEIKNPLTPIQLSAQRLRRRYGELIQSAEGQVLDEATRTIIDQVDGLKNMVNEFSKFAKLPEANPVTANLNLIVEEVLSLYRQAHPNIAFELALNHNIPQAKLDPEQIKRVIVNILDNAVSALEGVSTPTIAIETMVADNYLRLTIADNGQGLTAEARERLFEPYYSTKEGGTGLGLAIVKSTMSDHRGYVKVEDNKPGGIRIILEFPLPGANE